jgi:cytochrome c-type biogenesis protein CcmF
MSILVIFLVMGSISRWKKTSAAYLKKQLLIVAVASVVLGLVLPLALTLELRFGASIATALGLWVVLGILQDIRLKIANKGFSARSGCARWRPATSACRSHTSGLQ